MQIEISIAETEDDNFEHEGYYDSIEEAIKHLEELKDE